VKGERKHKETKRGVTNGQRNKLCSRDPTSPQKGKGTNYVPETTPVHKEAYKKQRGRTPDIVTKVKTCNFQSSTKFNNNPMTDSS